MALEALRKIETPSKAEEDGKGRLNPDKPTWQSTTPPPRRSPQEETAGSPEGKVP